MKVIALVCGLIIIGSIAVFGYFKIQNQTNSPNETTNSIPTNPPSITQIQTAEDLAIGGSSFKDPEGVYVFLYPNDYRLDIQGDEQYTRISKTGATQQGQTEMYDGVIMVFESVNLGNKTLSTWIDDSIKTMTIDGTTEIIEPKKSTRVNGYPGFTYTTRGLGESKYLILQKNQNSKSAVVITMLVADPENVGFQTEVDNILTTIQLLK